jgi:tetratricopeptide (TPR) repeat protein
MRRLLLQALLAAELLGWAGAPARGQLVEDYRFKGKVLDSEGKPIADVTVTLKDLETSARIQFKSHADGTFDRRMIPHAIYEATFSKSGYVSRSQKFDWSAPPSQVVTVEAKIVLETQAAHSEKELGAKTSKLYEESYAALAKGDCATATSKANEILKVGAGSFEYAVRFVLARCFAMQHDVDAAIAEYERVIALKPDLFEAHYDLGSLYEQQGKHDAALQEFSKAAELHPDDPEVQYDAGAILFRQQQFERARPYLEKAAELDSTNAQAHKALGFINLQSEKKDLTAARHHLEKYLALAPTAADSNQVRQILVGLRQSPQPK